MADRYLSAQEACELLGVSLRTLYRYIEGGQVRAYQRVPRGKLRFRREDLEGLLERPRSIEGRQLAMEGTD